MLEQTLPLKYFIENPELIGYCEQGFIRFESSSEILLFKQSQQNHRHREMYSYNLFLTELSGKDTFTPFNNLEHYEIRSSDDSSCALLDGWCHNRKHFAIDVYYDNNDKNLPNPFEILFYKSKGIEKKEEYPNEIKLILNSERLTQLSSHT